MKCSTTFRSLVLSSLFLSLAGLVTLRLSSDVVYGQPFALVCYTTTRTALYASFYRYQRASDIGINDLLASLGTVSGTTCQVDSVNLTRYNYSCSSDGKEISLIVPAENLMEHNTVWKCSNAEGPILSANNNVTIFVNVPVSSLQLSPSGKVNINEFETNTFTCTTSFCRPQATISWWKNDGNITNTAVTLTYDEKYTTGNLKYIGNRLDNGLIIMCKASNGYGVEKTSQQSIVLNIRYAPAGSPSIGGYPNGSTFSVIENTPQSLSCRITGGNPLASLTWNCFGFVGSVNIVEQTVTSNITMNISRNRVDQPCQCLSIHEVQGNRTAVILVQVLYTALISAFTAKDNKNMIKENDSLQLHCQVDSYPYSDIFLYHEDNIQLMKEENALKLNYTKKTVECLDAGKYTCHANNSIMNGNSVSSDLQIMVACYPRLDHRKYVSTIYHKGMNDNVTLEVYVIAYPEPTNITWYHRENETDTWQRVTYQSPSSHGLFSSILIHLISKSDFGYYMVTMENYLGNFSNTYRIVPEILSTSESVGLPVTGIAGGISAGFVGILIVVIGIFLWKRYQWKKRNEHENITCVVSNLDTRDLLDNDVKREHEERRNRIKASSDKQDETSGKEYEGLHFTEAETEANQYLQLNGIMLEENRITNISLRSPESDSYEKLHPCANNDIQMYSSLKISKTFRDSEKKK